MVGFFYLQVNLISILFDKFWRIAGDMIFLNCYSNILKRKHISKKPDNNSFHHTDEFFLIVIEAMVVTLFMHEVGCFIIDELQTWIDRCDWPALIIKVERDHLGIFILQYIQNKASIKTNTTVTSMLETKKRKWLESGDH